MNEQVIRIGESAIVLHSENIALAGLIEETEKRHTESITRQYEIRRHLDDYDSLPVTQDIEKEIEKKLYIGENAPQAPHAQNWETMRKPKALKQLKRLENQIVLDLGNGKTTEQFQNYVKRFGAIAYIGVDIRNIIGKAGVIPKSITGFGVVRELSAELGEPMPGIMVRSDLLRVASRLPDDSVSVALNGIDNYIVNIKSAYGKRLKEEIKRILHPDGLIFGLQTGEGLLSEFTHDNSLSCTRISTGIAHFRSEAGYYFISKT